MPPTDKERIEHIIEACKNIETFVKQEKDLYDLKTELAVVRCYEIIGEASNHVSDSLKEELSDIPWRDVIDMRKKIVHEYFRVEQSVLFFAAIRDVPELRMVLQKWVDKQQS